MPPLSHYAPNPHYFSFRGKPTLLVGSGEHYGAVLNKVFDYKAYLKAVAESGLNLTRTFCGGYREIPNSFGIVDNTLAPKPNDFLCPWLKVDDAKPGTYEHYDLSRWDESFFTRLTDFLAEADRRGVIVELVPFCFYYNPELWEASPYHPA